MTQEPKAQQEGLGRRAKRGASWIIAGAVVGNLLRLASNLIMTRLLLPEAFGMLALASTILTAINLSTDMGIFRSISREPDGDTPHFLRVAWVVKVLRSTVIAGGILSVAVLIWLLAPGLASEGTIYARPEMPGLVAMIAIAPLLRGMGSTTWELAVRNLDRKSIEIWSVLPQFISIFAMIGFAQISPTVWALMCGMLTHQLVQTLATHLVMPGPKMRFVWDKEIADRLWTFGKWIMGSSFLGFVARNADKFVLGALLGATTFGLYVISQIWLEAGRTVIRQIGGGIGFPVIAEAYRTRPDEVPQLYRRFQYRIDVMCVLGFVAALFGGPAIVALLYPENYHEAGLYLQLTSFAFLVQRFGTLTNLVLNVGNSRATVPIAAISAVSSVCLMSAGYWLMDLKGAIFGVVIAPMMALPYVFSLVRPILGAAQARIDMLWAMGVLLTIAAGFWWL